MRVRTAMCICRHLQGSQRKGIETAPAAAFYCHACTHIERQPIKPSDQDIGGQSAGGRHNDAVPSSQRMARKRQGRACPIPAIAVCARALTERREAFCAPSLPWELYKYRQVMRLRKREVAI